MDRLGLIAGAGDLPLALARHCREIGRPLFVLRLRGAADSALEAFPGEEVGIGQLGRALRLLRVERCASVCLAGYVRRPEFRSLRPDARGLIALPGAMRAAAGGDDALLTWLVSEFEGEGFAVEGAQQVMGALLLPAGPLGRSRPAPGHLADIDRAMQVAARLGELDVGQAVVCCEGLILAVEAQEGTDAMLERVAALPPAIRGAPGAPRGVLAKVPRPGQDRRIDLPTIGRRTIEGVRAAGLAGIVGEAVGLIVLDRDAAIALADREGLFVFGAPARR